MTGVHIHLLLNHLPVIGTIVALLLLAFAVQRRSVPLTRASLALFALLAVVGLAVYLTGEPAEHVIEDIPGLRESTHDFIEEHEDAALFATWLLGAVGALSLGGLIVYRKRPEGIPRRFAVIVLILSLFPTVAMIRTAYLGGLIRHTEIRGGAVQDTILHEDGITMRQSEFLIPESMRAEHREVHESLVVATQVPGKVGEAAREVARVLDPHFKREEEIALPPLGLLPQLSRGEVTEEMAGVLPLTDALRVELPRMLQEHQQIHKALSRLAEVAKAENQPEYERLAEAIMHHASGEEQVSYPTALLVGDHVRLKLGR